MPSQHWKSALNFPMSWLLIFNFIKVERLFIMGNSKRGIFKNSILYWHFVLNGI